MKITDVESDTPPRILLMGASGTGKTMLIGRMHKRLKEMGTAGIRYFDFDASRTLQTHGFDLDIGDRSRPYIDLKRSKGTAFLDFAKDFSQYESHHFGFGGFAVDSLTTFQKTAMNYVHKINQIKRHLGFLSAQQDYGVLVDIMSQFLPQFMNVSMHSLTIVTCHIRIKEDELSQIKEEVPAIIGASLPSQIGAWFNEVWYTYIDNRTNTGRTEYMVKTVSDRYRKCKTQTKDMPLTATQEEIVEFLFKSFNFKEFRKKLDLANSLLKSNNVEEVENGFK